MSSSPPAGASASTLAPLFTDRLVLVTGKGGTGKTTFAAAVAALQAAKGRRTVLCEVDAQQPALAPIFGLEPGFEPVRVAEGLDVCNLVWPASLGSYLQRMIRIGRVVRTILDNEMVRRFLDFVPGSQELVTVSAIVDLLDRYDCVVVDLPASGHAFSLLDITRSALGLFRAGPIRGRVKELRRTLQDPRTRVLFVALPEDMVVTETLETVERFRQYELVGAEPVVFLNRATAPSLTEAEGALLDRLHQAGLTGPGAELVAAGRWERSLEQAAAEAQDRLTDALERPPVLVPPVAAGGNPRAAAHGVAVHLGRLVGVGKQELTWT